MSKEKWFGKKNNEPMGSTSPKVEKKEEVKLPTVETAVLLVQYENGGKTSAITKITGVPVKREATIADIQRMAGEISSVIQVNWTIDALLSVLTPPKPVAQVDPNQNVVDPNIPKKEEPIK